MGRRATTTALGLLLLLVAGCGGSTFDEEGFDQVEAWADDAIPAVDLASMDAAAWLTGGDVGADRIDEHVDELNGVYDAGGSLPDDDEIASWGLNLRRGERSTEIRGEELLAAVTGLRGAIGTLADDLDFALRDDADNDDRAFARESVVEAAAAAEQLRAIFTID